jgi:hypothetical protein
MYPPEQHKVHWFLAHVIELLEITFNDLGQLLHVTHFYVILGIVFGVGKIAVHQTAKVIFNNLQVKVKL